MAVPLLATKLFAPPTRPGLVPRSGLIQRLNTGLEQDQRFTHRLSLISYP